MEFEHMDIRGTEAGQRCSGGEEKPAGRMRRDRNLTSAELQRKDVCEKAWLHYFNRTLFEEGLITERERNRMTEVIEERKRTRTK